MYKSALPSFLLCKNDFCATQGADNLAVVCYPHGAAYAAGAVAVPPVEGRGG